MQPRALAKNLDRQILATHRRFVKAMAERLGSMRLDSKERYFAVLSVLVAKLEGQRQIDARRHAGDDGRSGDRDPARAAGLSADPRARRHASAPPHHRGRLIAGHRVASQHSSE
jgi:hypothetical protein